jgi:hypothetical protein
MSNVKTPRDGRLTLWDHLTQEYGEGLHQVLTMLWVKKQSEILEKIKLTGSFVRRQQQPTRLWNSVNMAE